MQILDRIGSGSYADVWGLPGLACKLPTNWLLDAHTTLREGLLLRHGYGVALEYLCVNEKRFVGFAMARAHGTIDKWQAISQLHAPDALVAWTHDILAQLAKLHDVNIVHGDIKGRNILIMPDSTATLCDFGLAQKIRPGFEEEAYTLNYRPPELLKSTHKIATSSDIWALGMTLYECVFDLPTLGLSTAYDIYKQLETFVPPDADTRRRLISSRFLTRYKRVCPQLVNFMSSALTWDPMRPSAHELLAAFKHFERPRAWPTTPKPGRSRRAFALVPLTTDTEDYVPKPSALEVVAATCKSLCTLAQLDPSLYTGSAQALYLALSARSVGGSLVRAVVASAFAIFLLNPCSVIRPDVCVRLALTTFTVLEATMQEAMVVALQTPSWASAFINK